MNEKKKIRKNKYEYYLLTLKLRRQPVFKRLLMLELVLVGIFAISLVVSSLIIPLTDCSNGSMRSEPPNPSVRNSDLVVRFIGDIFKLANFVVVALVAPSPAVATQVAKVLISLLLFSNFSASPEEAISTDSNNSITTIGGENANNKETQDEFNDQGENNVANQASTSSVAVSWKTINIEEKRRTLSLETSNAQATGENH
uniref:Uncharacterized protein n=1 Tax=Glossina pallidipes TaxID=7398 RepID=A0A1B0AGY3_GLOPL